MEANAIAQIPKPGFGLRSFDSKPCVLSKHCISLLLDRCGQNKGIAPPVLPSQAQVCALWEAGDRGTLYGLS